MTIGLEGLMTPENSTRDIAYLDVEHNGNQYKWQIYAPQGINIIEYLQIKEQSIYDDIDDKELEWTNLTPKTREVIDPMTGETTIVDILKGEIVRPDMNIPATISMRQARLVLLQAGLLSSIESAIASIPGAEGAAARIEWEYAQEVNIDSPLVRSLTSQLGLSAKQVNELFKQGKLL